jgi:predicted aspartyl protease
MIRHTARLVLLLGALSAVPALRAQRVTDSVTVPLIVEGNRPYVQVTFQRADGSTRSARMLLDTGGGGFLLTEPLARDLGLATGATMREEGQEFAAVTSPVIARVGSFALTLNPQRIAVLVGKDNVLPNAKAGHAEGMIPGHVLAKHHVVFDYPARTFTVAAPGRLVPRGTSLSMPVSKSSGFPRTEWEIDGTTYGMLLDTGASFTMVSEVVLKAWGERHPNWPRYPGAYGEAATLGGQTLETMMPPQGRWGPFPLTEIGVTSQREGTFERYMSGMMRAPIVGSMAGNVLKHFRVELDYANEKLYLSRP